MNDISTPTPSAAPPSSAPSSSPIEPTPSADLAKMAQTDDVSEYAEQRREDAGEVNQDLSPAQRNFSRHQRQRKVIEKLSAENAALKAQGASPRGSDNTPDDLQQWHDELVARQQADQPAAEQPTGDEQQQPQEQEPLEEQLAREVRATLEKERQAAVFQHRKEVFAQQFPDYQQVLAQAPPVPIPSAIEDQIVSSKWGPYLQYGLAHPSNQDDLVRLLQASPREAERMIDRWEAQIEAGFKYGHFGPQQRPQYQPQPRRVTQAPRPIRPLTGSAGPTPNLGSLANSDNIDAYARQRLAQMRAKLDR